MDFTKIKLNRLIRKKKRNKIMELTDENARLKGELKEKTERIKIMTDAGITTQNKRKGFFPWTR